MYDVKLVGEMQWDLSFLVQMGQQALGHNPAQAVDRSLRKLSTAERTVSILAGLKDQNISPDFHPNLLNFYFQGVSLVVDERDLPDVTTVLSGLNILVLTTVTRGLILLVVVGSLNQWRNAIITGTNSKGETQGVFCKLYQLFQTAGLTLWKDHVTKTIGQTFLLEHKTK